jgi:radical SAM superfamily enzyme YgiQ (UPF0313 family)
MSSNKIIEIKSESNDQEGFEKLLRFINTRISNNLETKSKYDGIKKFLLISPPEMPSGKFIFNIAKRGRYVNIPPYGLAALATHLRDENIEVQILNLNDKILRSARESKDEIEFNYDESLKNHIQLTLENFKPDIIGFTCMFGPTYQSLLDTIYEVHSYYHKQNPINVENTTPLMIAGGVWITLNLQNKSDKDKLINDLKGKIDFYFSGESENSLINFTKFLKEKTQKNYNQLSQIIATDSLGNIVIDKSLIKDFPDGICLDKVPSHDLIDPREIRLAGTIGGFYSLLSSTTIQSVVQSNRGCRANCSFCGVRNINGKGVRRRSVQSVIDELKHLHFELGVGHITWLDDDFLFDSNESIYLFNEIVRNNINITFDCSNGVIAGACKPNVIAAAEAAGCIGLILGIESGNPKILREIRKPGSVEGFMRASEVFSKFPKINTRGFLMLGFPGETFSQIYDTYKLALDMKLDWYNISVVIPVPGTSIYEAMVASGEILPDFSELRLNSGPTQKAYNSMSIRDPLSIDFKDAFNGKDMNAIPTKYELDEIWAYMQFNLNFEPLRKLNSSIKLDQQFSYVNNICDLIAPENCFALYYLGLLQEKKFGFAEESTVLELNRLLENSEYWTSRFKDFKLNPYDLNTRKTSLIN